MVPGIIVDDAQIERLATRPVALPPSLPPNVVAGLNAVVLQLRRGNREAARNQWERAVQVYVAREGPSGYDINAMMQHVLRESHRETLEAMRNQAARLRYYNQWKKTLRDHLSDTRDAVERFHGHGAPLAINVAVVATYPGPYRPGAAKPKFRWTSRKMNRGALKAYIRDIEKRMSTLGNESQLANLELQSMRQKRQRFLATMSNVSKMMHDTAMSVIRNMK